MIRPSGRAARDGERAMDTSTWAQRRPPETGPGGVLLGAWEPATPAAATRARRELATALGSGAGPAVERLLLCHEELTSNALRHGRPPVRVEVTEVRATGGGGWWLIDVSDAAPGTAPAPATDRDPALGGLGLHLVAALSSAHGWWTGDGRKHVWARVPLLPTADAVATGAR
jgi:hypothetical protein